MTIATAIGSIVFGAVYKVLRNKVYWPALVVIAAGYFVLAATNSQIVTVVTLAVVGLAMALLLLLLLHFLHRDSAVHEGGASHFDSGLGQRACHDGFVAGADLRA